MGKTHLKPLIAVIIQSAKLTESEQKEVIIQSAELTESEQTNVCSEAHNLQANWRRLKFVPKRTIPLESAQMWPVIAQPSPICCANCANRNDPVCFSDRIISSKARFGCEQ